MNAAQTSFLPDLDRADAAKVNASALTEPMKLAKVKDDLEILRADELERRRRKARELVYRNIGMTEHRVNNSVTTDDINAALLIPVYSKGSKGGMFNNMNGLLFRNKNGVEFGRRWVYLGEVESHRKNSHRNGIGLYTLAPYADQAREQFNGIAR